jgi:hypothetical protein
MDLPQVPFELINPNKPNWYGVFIASIEKWFSHLCQTLTVMCPAWMPTAVKQLSIVLALAAILLNDSWHIA